MCVCVGVGKCSVFIVCYWVLCWSCFVSVIVYVAVLFLRCGCFVAGVVCVLLC